LARHLRILEPTAQRAEQPVVRVRDADSVKELKVDPGPKSGGNAAQRVVELEWTVEGLAAEMQRRLGGNDQPRDNEQGGEGKPGG
jgi:hypothetical protein